MQRRILVRIYSSNRSCAERVIRTIKEEEVYLSEIWPLPGQILYKGFDYESRLQ